MFRSVHDSIIKENIKKRSCKLQHLKRFWREKLTYEGAKIVKTFLKRL